MRHVLVTGLPGSGKTTLAGPLATELGLPLVAKDAIKETLFDVLGPGNQGSDDTGPGDLSWSHRLGLAAIHLQLRLLADAAAPLLVECAFLPGVSEAELAGLGHGYVQVHCRCPFEMARSRYLARRPSRHPGHGDDRFEAADFDRFAAYEPPLALPGPVVAVDTTGPVDVEDVAARVRRALDELAGD
ncbi:MAG: AAA family ATPase [Acidimicrobiia bacterium]